MIDVKEKDIIKNLNINKANITKYFKKLTKMKIQKNPNKSRNIKKKAAVGLLTFTIGTGPIIYLLENNLKDNAGNTFTSASEVYKCIDENDNLDDNEKEIIYYISDFIEDYYYYMDTDLVENQLSKFDIKYKNTTEQSITGSWHPIIKNMNFYTFASSDELDKNQGVASHELLHLLSTSILSGYSKLLYEGITSLINYEYSEGEYCNLYYKQVLVVQSLCEILGGDCVIKSYLQSDEDIIRDRLLKIDNDEDRVDRLFKNFDRYQYIYDESIDYFEIELDDNTYQEYCEIKELEQDVLTSIVEDLKYYYETKTKKELSASDIMADYLDRLIEDNNQIVIDDNKTTIYFNDWNIPSLYFPKSDKVLTKNN